MLGVLLVLLFWGAIMLTLMGPFAPQPEAFDRTVADFALALRNDLTDPAMVAFSQLSRWQVTLLAAVAVLLARANRRDMKLYPETAGFQIARRGRGA